MFGFLLESRRGKKYLLCIMDAFSKYVELVVIKNKEASTVAEAIFDRWFCQFGVPAELVTDGAKEFCTKVLEEFMKRMGFTHLDSVLSPTIVKPK